MRHINVKPTESENKRIAKRASAHGEMAKSNFRSVSFTREPWYLTAARKEKERVAELEKRNKED